MTLQGICMNMALLYMYTRVTNAPHATCLYLLAAPLLDVAAVWGFGVVAEVWGLG